MKIVRKMPKFTDEELKKMYEQVYKSHKIQENKKHKEEIRKYKRKGDYSYE